MRHWLLALKLGWTFREEANFCFACEVNRLDMGVRGTALLVTFSVIFEACDGGCGVLNFAAAMMSGIGAEMGGIVFVEIEGFGGGVTLPERWRQRVSDKVKFDLID